MADLASPTTNSSSGRAVLPVLVVILLVLAVSGAAWYHSIQEIRSRQNFLAQGVEAEAVLLGRGRDAAAGTDRQAMLGFVATGPVREMRVPILHQALGNISTSSRGSRSFRRSAPEGPLQKLRMRVLYLPHNPTQVLLLPPQRWMLWIQPVSWAAFGSLPMLLLLGLLWAGRRSQRIRVP